MVVISDPCTKLNRAIHTKTTTAANLHQTVLDAWVVPYGIFDGSFMYDGLRFA